MIYNPVWGSGEWLVYVWIGCNDPLSQFQVNLRAKRCGCNMKCPGYFSDSCSVLLFIFLSFFLFHAELLEVLKLRFITLREKWASTKCFLSLFPSFWPFSSSLGFLKRLWRVCVFVCMCVLSALSSLLMVVYSLHRCGFVANRIFSTDSNNRPAHKWNHLKIIVSWWYGSAPDWCC